MDHMVWIGNRYKRHTSIREIWNPSSYPKVGLEPTWFVIQFDSLLIRNRIDQWFANKWITIHLPKVGYLWFLIRFDFDSQVNHFCGWIVIRDESKSNRIKINCESELFILNESIRAEPCPKVYKVTDFEMGVFSENSKKFNFLSRTGNSNCFW